MRRLALLAAGIAALAGAWLLRGARVEPAAEAPLVPRITGAVRDQQGAPVAGATVRCESRAVTTGADGRFAIDIDPQPFLFLEAKATGYATVRRGLTRDELDAAGWRADFTVCRPMPIEGRVVDQHGRPVVGADVDASLLADATVRIFTDDTGEDGTFRLDDAHAGLWWLRLSHPPDGDWSGQREILVSPADGPLELILQRGEGRAALVLDVVDARTGAPVPQSALELASLHRVEDTGPMWHRELEIGTGRIVARGLGPGRFKLAIGDAIRHFEIPPGAEEVRERVELGAKGAIVGSVDLGGVLANPGILVLSALEGRVAKPDQSAVFFENVFLGAENGYSFRLEDVRSGMPIDLDVRAVGVWGRARVTVGPLREEHVAIPLRRTGRVTLNLASPPPVRLVVLDFLPAAGPEWAVRRHVQHGVREVEVDLPAGEAKWSVRWPHPKDGTPVVREGEATVRAGSATAVDVDLR